MDSGSIDCLVMTLFSAVVCFCFPRVLTIVQATAVLKIKQISENLVQSSASEPAQSTAYTELTTANN